MYCLQLKKKVKKLNKEKEIDLVRITFIILFPCVCACALHTVAMLCDYAIYLK